MSATTAPTRESPSGSSAKVLCPLCASGAVSRIAVSRSTLEVWRCRGCRLDFARYLPTDDHERERPDHFRDLDLEKYNRSVKATRQASYAKLLARVQACTAGGNWLDVGCSYGWLLEYLKGTPFHGFGVEPSEQAARQATAAGHQVQLGLYPQVTGGATSYSVISFMDVLEHLENPAAVLAATRDLLVPSGVVVIQVPDRSCLLYRVAETMCRLTRGRADFALRRLWLADIDFPHRFYFTIHSLRSVLQQSGYEIVHWYRSSIGSPLQAFDRVSYLPSGRGLAPYCTAAGVAAINTFDALTGHGGLLTAIARPSASRS